MKRRVIGGLLVYALVLGTFLGISCMFSRTVTVIARQLPVERRYTLILDAGHGGEDGGAVSCTGIPESTLNLQIVLRLKDILHLLGYRTELIRDTDRSVYTQGDTLAQKKISDLKERVRLVNEIPDGILVSIHQNTFSDSRYAGPQVFYADTPGSQELARDVQNALDPENRRSIKKAQGIYLMRNIETTGILIECGFLSNPAEEAKLRNDAYQKKLCALMGVSLARFLTK